ncbi:hypothetical protein KQH60_08540 [Mycetohabitans sp. B8]|uniref:hypothetical protein n=1 Tax=Mycetohabitans sp. B8 TaxID=2841845 RepID=UPI001F208D55|nr:hypothetical protein [Mycetohabitans sp. B8]MCG1042587.1 hypothetical protein [Mycetohabitans sp. B8]
MHAVDYFQAFAARRIPVVTDSTIGSEIAKKHGFTTVDFDDFDFSSPSNTAFLLITTYETHTRLRDLWDTAKAVVAHLALAKFDCSAETIGYSMAKLLTAPFSDTLNMRKNAYADMLCANCIEFDSKGQKFICRFSDDVLIANNEDKMEPGWMYSVAEFFEASIVNIAGKETSFIVNGEFRFDGMIYLCNNAELKQKFGNVLTPLMKNCAAGNNTIFFKDSIAEKILIGGVDVTEQFVSTFSKLEQGLRAMEIALGCVDYPEPVDWNQNSVINEGTLGLHIGIGMGLEMPHIDFISSRARVVGAVEA